MSNFESALITTIVSQKDIRSCINQKITTEFFTDTNARAAYAFLLQWFNNPAYGDVPSWESFQEHFQAFVPVEIEESITALCDHLHNQKLYADIAATLAAVGEATQGDARKGFEILRDQVAVLTSAHTIDGACDVRNRIDELREEYFLMKSGATGLKGAPYPWDALNNATLGLQDQHLVFLFGRPKSGKTWCLLEILRNLHAHGKRPLVFSQELSDIEMCRRFVALSTNVDYGQFLRGSLPEEEEAEFMENLEMFIEQPPVIITSLTTTGPGCLTEMSAKIDEYRADVAAVDGVYFLGSDWKELAEITRGMKRLAKTKRIPIIGTTQANRSRGKKGDAQDGADDIAYGDSFYQDCLAPSTLVLDGDLNWVPVGSLHVGSQIVGFEEESQTRNKIRRWEPATVTGHRLVRRPAFRMTMESGTELITTREHRSLIRTRAGVDWATTEDIAKFVAAGKTVNMSRFVKPWTYSRDYDTGFLAAAFDGEGFLRTPIQCVGMSQRPNVFMGEVERSLTVKGFSFSLYKHSPKGPGAHGGHGDGQNLHVRGGMSETLRFLGEIRPPRLFEQFQDRFPDGMGVPAKWQDRVLSVEAIGMHDIVVMATSTKTFIAEGYGAHNCDLALRIVADIENRKQREAVLYTAAIREGTGALFKIHMKLASDLTQKSVEKMDADEDAAYADAPTSDESVVE